MSLTRTIENELNEIILNNFHPHPFENISRENDLKKIFSRFICLSQATPYLLSGASKETFLNKIQNGQSITSQNEITTSVLTFLAWDETGGQEVISKNGGKDIVKILNPGNYHSRVLKGDLEFLCSESLQPLYEQFTLEYFSNLINSLSNINDISRCASIIAFEMHAENVIRALWNSLDKLYPEIDKHSLRYFELHVGELNPVEEYHVQMTEKMVELIVSSSDKALFTKSFEKSYKLNNDWAFSAINNE